MKVNFYDYLLKSEKFCQKLGLLILLSGKLESTIKTSILEYDVTNDLSSATLVQLCSICKNDQILDDEILEVLDFIKVRLDYFTHRLFPLCNGEIEETILPKENLEPEDAEHYFTECVEILISHVQLVLDDMDQRD